MLDKMLEDKYDGYDGRSVSRDSEFIARGQYEQLPDEVLKGFGIFQKRYVYKNIAIQLILVIIAIVSQALALAANTSGDIMMNVMLIVFCFMLGVWILWRPFDTRKKLRNGIEHLRGTIYEAEIYDDKLKISTIYDAPVENGEAVDTDKLAESDKMGVAATMDAQIDEPDGNEAAEEIPATIIHLDDSSVEIIENKELYVVYVRKVNIFVIPKRAFDGSDIRNIDEKLSSFMGVRFNGGREISEK